MKPLTCLLATVLTVSAASAQDPRKPTQDAPAPDNAARLDGPKEEREIVIEEPRPGISERRSIRITGDNGDFHFQDGDGPRLGIVMDRSLEFNPEIQAIRAEIGALVAKLRQLEMKTATDVARKDAELKRLKDKREKDEDLVKKKIKSPEDLAELDAEIAAHDLELKYLIGASGRDGEFRELRLLRGDGPMIVGMGSPRPELKDLDNTQLRELMDKTISARFDNAKLDEVIRFIKEQHEINFNVDVSTREMPITIDVKNVKLRDLFVALSDSNPNLAFVVRDYGIFVTTRDRAMGVPGPSIPEDVPYRDMPRFGGTPHIERAERVIKRVPEQADRVLDYREGKIDTVPPVAPKPETAPAAPVPEAAPATPKL